jgi:hypothetical protein
MDLLLGDEPLGARPVLVDEDDLARLDLALVFDALEVEGAGLRRDGPRAPFLPSTSGRKPWGSRTAIISVGVRKRSEKLPLIWVIACLSPFSRLAERATR